MPTPGQVGPGRHQRCAATCALLLVVLGCCDEPVCGDCLSSDGDHVEFLNDEVTAQNPGLVLLTAWREGHCQANVLCTAGPDAYLGDVRWGPGDFPTLDWSIFCKKEELVLFAKGKAPHLEVMPPPDLQVSLSSAVDVPVSLWVAPTFPDLLGAEADMLSAKGTYETSGTGIDLRTKSTSYYSAGLPTTGVTCRNDVDAFAMSSSYDPNSLNIYYVQWLGDGLGGEICYDPDPTESHQEIIFVNGGASYSSVQIAHEIGHALGLVRSTPWGSAVVTTGDLFDEVMLDPYLTSSNLMKSSGIGTSLTLGQIYRMHFDKLSWLNRASSTTLATLLALSTKYPIECQNDPATGEPCPPLTLHPAGGWP